MNFKTQQFNFPSLDKDIPFKHGIPKSAVSQTPPKKENKFNDDDISKAQKDGYSKGYADGIKAGIEQGKGEHYKLEQQLNTSLGIIVGQLGQLLDPLKAIVEKKQQEVIKLAVLIAKKTSGDIPSEALENKIKSFVEQTVPLVLSEKSLIVKINPSLSASLESKISAIAKEKNYDGKIKISADASVPNGSCNIEWENGGVEYNPEHMWKEIYKIMGTEQLPQAASNNVKDDIVGKDATDNKNEHETTTKT